MEKFDIEVEGVQGIPDCIYLEHTRFGVPAIQTMSTAMTKERCYTILRELAKRSDEHHGGDEIEDGYWKIPSNLSEINEQGLLKILWNLQKSTYQKKILTPEEKIKGAIDELMKTVIHESPHVEKALIILEGDT